ncbi:uncharacterized protein LOC117777241 isoform X3 [Hippoglossus hippoglossus]|uniref:uncharacterized protein LOC117777241 isoform X3 n=1 Tax=Hippoglossus hippoglossus TaxID=8267 RepID=UPI00148BD88D|nr:uncharacterized protein LOC117777241 isoform X3 [Hippoglossus hippoglossus]
MKNLQTLYLLPLLALASLFIKISGSVSPRPVLTGPHMAYLNSRVAFRCTAPDSSPPVTYQLMRDGGIPIATGIDLQGDQSAPFFLKVAATSEGSYHCKATTEGGTGVSNIITLSVVSNELVMEQATPEHAGHYSCMAWSMVQDNTRFSSSTEVKVTVKAYVSKPNISFSIFKEGDGYQGNITCWSTRGSHPVNFSLSVDDKEVGSLTANESLTVWFLVAMVPGMDMGVARCWVKTEMQELMSEPVTLEVVPVGGDVTAEVEYLYRADSKPSAARLRCVVSRGTFPQISWLLNNSVLPSETNLDVQSQDDLTHVALANRRQTLVLTKLTSEESGYYRCRVRNSYDDSGPWVESGDVLVRVTDRILNSMPPATSSTETAPKAFMNPTEIITIAFCCFLLLMLAVGVACVYRMFDHNQAHAHIAATNSDPLPLTAPSSQSGDKQVGISSAD